MLTYAIENCLDQAVGGILETCAAHKEILYCMGPIWHLGLELLFVLYCVRICILYKWLTHAAMIKEWICKYNMQDVSYSYNIINYYTHSIYVCRKKAGSIQHVKDSEGSSFA